jgi:hypothetical protein
MYIKTHHTAFYYYLYYLNYSHYVYKVYLFNVISHVGSDYHTVLLIIILTDGLVVKIPADIINIKSLVHHMKKR